VTIAETLPVVTERLARAGVDTASVDAELLLAHVVGTSRSGLALSRRRPLSAPERERLDELLSRREQREPLAYVLGEWGFRRLVLRLDRRALVPRPETEVLVERCLALLAGRVAPCVLDVGTGSGAIALALADELPGARVTAVDASSEALELARENAARLRLDVDFRAGGVEAAAGGWDLVVSNPPYVPAADWASLQPEIREWEPRGALVDTGMHRALAEHARTEWLVLEVGDGQAQAVAATLAGLGYREIAVTRDLTGRERVVEGRRR
jgi:release factor glutamine methyltransferase